MGALFSRKKPVSEELETLSAQMKDFRKDIEVMNRHRRSALWYLSLIIFFASTSSVAYFFATVEIRTHQIFFSSASVVVGGLALILLRRIVNIFYDYRVRRKHAYLDELIAKKKSILDTVKETETFKVAKELLAKYDDEYSEEPKVPVTPAGMGRKTPLATPATLQRPQPMPQSSRNHPSSPTQQVRQRMIPHAMIAQQLAQGQPPQTPAGEPIPFPAAITMTGRGRPQSLKPIRPFAEEAKTNVEKVVDYFFGDGPNSRLALICAQCHGHNGMAFPGEFEYLAYICYICGHFNPARKLRNASGPPSLSGLSTPMISRQPSTRSLLSAVTNVEEDLKEDEENASKENSESESKKDEDDLRGADTEDD